MSSDITIPTDWIASMHFIWCPIKHDYILADFNGTICSENPNCKIGYECKTFNKSIGVDV